MAAPTSKGATKTGMLIWDDANDKWIAWDSTVDVAKVTGDISTVNSTTTVLDPAGVNVFTGTGEDVKDYKSIGISIIASHDSATNGLTFQFSSDNTNWDKVHSFTYTGGTGKFFNMPVESRYFRIVYTNGGTLQTYFRLQTIYHATMTKESTLRLSEDIDAETAAQLGRTVMAGKINGVYRNVVLDESTGVLPMITYEHHEIHSGSHFEYTEVTDLAINNVWDIQITTPDTTKWSHFVISFNTENETEWWFWENVTITTPGTAITEINSNRNSVTAATTTLASITNTSLANANADTAVASATLLKHGISGAVRVGGSASARQEIILKQDEDYSLRFDASVAGYVSVNLTWYEHTDVT
jgi:hypothetical protein